MLFRVDRYGTLLKQVTAAGTVDEDYPPVVVYRQFNEKYRSLSMELWMPMAEWQALPVVDRTTKGEARERGLGWMLLMIVSGLCLLQVVGLLLGDLLAHRPAQVHWGFVAKWELGWGLVFLFAAYRWWRRVSSWEVALG